MSSSTISIASATPRLLWDAYVEYLWNYQPNSWVGTTASFFRVLAIILVLPVVFLTLLDVTSYVIARTLGIVDDVKASTSDTDPPRSANIPSASLQTHGQEIQSRLTGGSEDLASEDLTHDRLSQSQFQMQMQMQNRTHRVQAQIQTPSDSQSRPQSASEPSPSQSHSWTSYAPDPARVVAHSSGSHLRPPEMYYFAGEEDLRLSGVGEFSPATSMPPSPLIPRTKLRTLDSNRTEGVVEMGEVNEDEGIVLRRRLEGAREGE